MGQILSSASEEPSPVASANRSESVSGGQLGGRPPTATVRTISQGGTSGRDLIRGANASNRASVVSNPGTTLQMSNMGPPIGPIAPLEVSANHRVAGSARSGSIGQGGDSPEVVVDRVVKALLNSLPTHFDSISDQIVAWANKSEKEKDGRTLMQVIKLVFKKAADEVTFSEMYARLCRKMMWQISPKVQHDGLKNSEGKPFAGGTLFRVYLLHRCQEDLEQSWVAKEATAAAAASKAKRRRLGLIRFFGELFKLQILTERLIHECIKKLLGNVENPDEEEIESLCKLLTTVGSLLDTPKAQAHLDVYFSRMRVLTMDKNVNTRMVFMLQDVIKLRERKWIPHNTVTASTRITQVPETAAKEKLAQEKVALRQQSVGMSSSSSRPSGTRDVPDVPRPDRRSVGGNQSAAPPQPKAGDLLQFGTINKVAPMTSAPTSVFNNKRGDLMSGDSLMSQTAPSPNMISKISHPKTSSEERFTTANRSVSISGGQLGGHSPTMVHTTSQGGTGSRDGIRSKPGANDSNRASLVNNPGTASLISNMSPPMEPFAPPRVSANSWVAGNAALPSALATARHIKDINRITYPEGIKSPKVELNVNTQKGKFRYDRDFLLQFRDICKERPDNLPPLDVLGLEPSANRSVSVSGGQRDRPPTMGTISQDGTGSRNRIRSKRGTNGSSHASVVSNPDATSQIFAAPTTIAQVHEAAIEEKLAQERVASMRQDVRMSFSNTRPSAIAEQPKSKIDKDVEEFFSIRMLDVAESYFSSLPTEDRHRLVDALVMTSVEMKEPDVKLVSDLFVRARKKGLCSPAAFEEGFNQLADLLDDFAAMVLPKAWSYFATLLKGSGLDQHEERYTRIAEKTTDPDRLNQLM